MPSIFDGDPEPEILESGPRGRTAYPLPHVPRWLTLVAVAVLLVGGGAVLAVVHGRHVTPGPTSPAVHAVSAPDLCVTFGNVTNPGPTGTHRVGPGDGGGSPTFPATASAIRVRQPIPSARRTGLVRCCAENWFALQGVGHNGRCDLRLPAPPGRPDG